MSENKFAVVIDDIADLGPDMNEAQGGGGDYVPPAEGVARARFVGYIEIGKHDKVGENAKPAVDQVHLVFELHGAKWPTKTLEDGTVIPQRITVKLTRSLNEKATMFKLFKRMNYEGKAKHFSQLLGQGYLVTVKHFTPKGSNVVIANLRDDQGNLTIRAPRMEVLDEETGELEQKKVAVPAQVGESRLFVWDGKDEWFKVMWPELGNFYQELITKAVNFEGSPIQAYLTTNGITITPPAKKADEETEEPAPKKGAVTDPDEILNNL